MVTPSPAPRSESGNAARGYRSHRVGDRAGRAGAIGSLLDRAVEAGDIRADVSAEDLLRTLVGMCLLHDQPGWQASVMRMLDVFIDGLRAKPGAGKPAASRSPKR